MTPRETRFKQAAWAYLIYGVVYMGGAVYLAGRGIGARGMSGTTGGVIWFALGALFIVVFPWLISKGARGGGYLWFTRILALLVAYRAFELGRGGLAPRPAPARREPAVRDCPVPPGPTPGSTEVTWTPEALDRLQRAPIFLRE